MAKTVFAILFVGLVASPCYAGIFAGKAAAAGAAVLAAEAIKDKLEHKTGDSTSATATDSHTLLSAPVVDINIKKEALLTVTDAPCTNVCKDKCTTTLEKHCQDVPVVTKECTPAKKSLVKKVCSKKCTLVVKTPHVPESPTTPPVPTPEPKYPTPPPPEPNPSQPPYMPPNPSQPPYVPPNPSQPPYEPPNPSQPPYVPPNPSQPPYEPPNPSQPPYVPPNPSQPPYMPPNPSQPPYVPPNPSKPPYVPPNPSKPPCKQPNPSKPPTDGYDAQPDASKPSTAEAALPAVDLSAVEADVAAASGRQLQGLLHVAAEAAVISKVIKSLPVPSCDDVCEDHTFEWPDLHCESASHVVEHCDEVPKKTCQQECVCIPQKTVSLNLPKKGLSISKDN